jgi:hypothetical protein
VLLTDEELHNELDDFADIGCHRRVVAVHLIDDCLEQMCHTLQHLILKSLHIFLYFFMLVDLRLTMLGF